MKNYVFILVSFLLLSITLCGDINAAADYVSSHAGAQSQHRCAEFVANALQYGGGFVFDRQRSAYMYHTNGILSKLGFTEIDRPSSPLKGDVYVQMNTASHGDGHMAMYDGRNWCSDFRQNSDQIYRSDAGERHYYRY